MDHADLSKLKINRNSLSPVRSARRWRRTLIAGILITAVVIIGAWWRFTAEIPVEIVTASTGYPYQAYTLLNATGYVVPQRKAAVASKASGRLEWLGVMEGSRVKKDEIVARLENKDVSASMEQAAANVEVARANLSQGMAELNDAEAAYKRSKDLMSKNYISQASLDSAEARYKKAKAGITALRAVISVAEASHRAAEVAYEQTLIRAPFDGVVLTKSANIGDVIIPFSSALDTKGAVVAMADMSTLEVEADVSESNLAKIKVDQPAEVQLDAFPDVRFQGVVSRMVPTVDRAKATLLVKVKFVEPDPRVLPDMSAKVAFLSKPVTAEERKAMVVVHSDAITTRHEKSVVFLVNEGKAVETEVTTGRKIGDLVEVSGIKSGDKVVMHPPGKLSNGSRIKVGQK